ncbi:MAG: fumarylacetoacetate (FAA) hydrolase [Candidatus Azotimanducaceae bacterium]|jgi:fumarylacetoacetate (FAA) hydrolase
MKLASINNNTRDGSLLVVSRDLKIAASAMDIAGTLQEALDNWEELSPRLLERFNALNERKLENTIDFDQGSVLSPLPRAYQWADGSAYVNHVELVRKARNAEMPDTFWTDPLMYQGGSDTFLAPRGDIKMSSEEWGIDFESEIAVITGDVAMGASLGEAADAIKLFMLVNDVSLRNLIPGELAKGFGFFQAKPSSAFSPVAVTKDELGVAWDGSRLNLPLVTHFNGELFGRPDAGVDMTFDFPTLVSHAAKTRPLGAGCIVGSGTVSNYDRSAGSSCLAEVRMLETINEGKPSTPFMKFDDTVRIEMFDEKEDSIFGSIENRVVKYEAI